MNIFKNIHIQNFFSVSTVKSLNITVLHRFPSLASNVSNTEFVAKALKSFCSKFGSIITTNRFRFAAPLDNLFNDSYYLFYRKRVVYRDI